MSTQAIEASGLVKSFGAATAVNEVDLVVPRGSVYGVLGPNGAGKTTTIRILATLLRPDRGTALVFGHDVVDQAKEVRRLVSLTGQFASVDADMTGEENLRLVGRLLGLSRSAARVRSNELLERFDLADAGKRRVGTYSGGMRRRLDVAASLIARPEILFLDEPTTGLDPRSRNQVWETVRTLVDSGTTVLLTTQYLEEADRLTDRIAVIDQGRVIAEGTSSELKGSVGSATLHVTLADVGQRNDAERLLRETTGSKVHLGADRQVLSAPVPDPQLAGAAIARLSNHGVTLNEFTLAPPSLDEAFLALTGRPPQSEPEQTSTETRKDDAA